MKHPDRRSFAVVNIRFPAFDTRHECTLPFVVSYTRGLFRGTESVSEVTVKWGSEEMTPVVSSFPYFTVSTPIPASEGDDQPLEHAWECVYVAIEIADAEDLRLAGIGWRGTESTSWQSPVRYEEGRRGIGQR